MGGEDEQVGLLGDGGQFVGGIATADLSCRWRTVLGEAGGDLLNVELGFLRC